MDYMYRLVLSGARREGALTPFDRRAGRDRSRAIIAVDLPFVPKDFSFREMKV
jgi:hypothetical protein